MHAAGEFCEWVQVGIEVFIPHCKHQVKDHSSPWFSGAFTAAIIHRNHFFCLYQQNKFSKFKVKFRKLPNFHMLMKQKSLSLPRNLALRSFFELPIVLSTNKNLLYHHNCLLQTFLRTLILMAQVSLYLFFLLELTWNCIIFL